MYVCANVDNSWVWPDVLLKLASYGGKSGSVCTMVVLSPIPTKRKWLRCMILLAMSSSTCTVTIVIAAAQPAAVVTASHIQLLN